MDTSLKDQAASKINNAQSIAIAVNKQSNLDGLASGLALYLSLKKLGKNVSILAKAPTVSDARLLYGVGDIGQKSGSKNLVIGVNNAVENVDKVTYFLEGNVLKVIVHALPGSQGVKQEDLVFDRDYQAADVLISVGFNDLALLNTEVVREQKIDPNVFIINVSLDKPVKKFAQIEIIDPTSPSLSQLTASLLEALALPIDEDISFNLYTGIASATQMFSPSIVKPETLSTSAWLLKFGAGKAGLAQGKIQATKSNLPPESYIPTSSPRPQDQQQTVEQLTNPADMTPIEMVEREKHGEEDWLKPPKIYRGSKSFDIES